MTRQFLLPLVLSVAGGCADTVTIVDARFVDDTTVVVEFSHPRSNPGGARPDSFRLSVTSAVRLSDVDAQTTESETRHEMLGSPAKRECLAACEEDECDACDEMPDELEVAAVRYTGELDRIYLELAEAPSLVECTALDLNSETLVQDAEDRGLVADVDVGFMVHYAAGDTGLRFEDGLVLADQGGAWVTDRDDFESTMTLDDDYLGEFDVDEPFGCYEP